ncbi:protein unc-45 homolog B-like [Temnothorax longispinosus]|uniref:protein unc-45 homolog B-like n=1 Tax=Temnothorax longispinosus TaxID=300112 RepID=UPI003A99DD1F
MTAQEWKKKGDEDFNHGNWSEALSHYTNAIKLVTEDNAEKAVYYKFRAATYLNICDYDRAIKDCDSVLKICYNDAEALYRKCQALKAVGRFEEALRNAEIIISSMPDNRIVQSVISQLLKILQECRENARISTEVSEMMDLVFNMKADNQKRENAMNNLFVLARGNAGAEEILKKEGIHKLAQLVKAEENEKVTCTAIRIVGTLCKNNISRTEFVVKYVGLLWCLEMINCTSIRRVNASQYCLQNILNTYSGMTNNPDSKLDKALCKKYKKEIFMILSFLLNSITSRTISGLARDALIGLITRNIHYTALNWAKRLVDLGGLQRLMEVASETMKYECESSMDITSSTRTIISVCLTKIYENMWCEDDKRKFVNAIAEFIEDKLRLSDIDSNKVRIVLAITTLIFGSLDDVVDVIIFNRLISDMMLLMSKTNDLLQQKVVCECIVAAIIKYNTANVFICRNINTLENLYQSKDDSIRVQALVGLCKLSRFDDSFLRDSATIDPFTDKATKKLTKICRQLLINPKKEDDTIWAIKGLSYLTFDAEIKEKFIEDQRSFKRVVQVMNELAKTGDQSVLYAVATTLVNLCNAYDDQELIPEMKELLMFSSYHHFFARSQKLNHDEFVTKRRCALAKADVTSALVSLAKTDSQNCKELVARVFHAICSQQELREIIVQQGGTEALLSLALSGTDKGKKHASRALVYLGLRRHPEVAFSGQIIMEVVRPMVNLLNPECSVYENSETLTALRNLASVNDHTRQRIFNEAGFPKIADYMNSKHYMLKLRSAQLLDNLTLCREVAIRCYKQDNSDVISLVSETLYADKNENMYKVNAGVLTRVTAISKSTCENILNTDPTLKELSNFLANSDGDLQCRGIKILLNIMRNSKDAVAKIIETDVMESLRTLSKNDNAQNKEVKELASLALEIVAEWVTNQEKRSKGYESSQSIDNKEYID